MKKNPLTSTITEINILENKVKKLQEKLATNFTYTVDNYKEDLKAINKQKDYLEHRLKILLIISTSLNKIKRNPKEELTIKNLNNIKDWSIFSQNLKPHQWLPFDGDMCDVCGRVSSSTTKIAAIICPKDKQFKIICSRCFSNSLKTTTQNIGDINATE